MQDNDRNASDRTQSNLFGVHARCACTPNRLWASSWPPNSACKCLRKKRTRPVCSPRTSDVRGDDTARAHLAPANTHQKLRWHHVTKNDGGGILHHFLSWPINAFNESSSARPPEIRPPDRRADGEQFADAPCAARRRGMHRFTVDPRRGLHPASNAPGALHAACSTPNKLLWVGPDVDHYGTPPGYTPWRPAALRLCRFP